jgi:tetratricopeptide (TPR) repeat protein
MGRTRVLLRIVLLALAVIASPVVGHAKSAAEQFGEGLAEFDAGNFEKALPLFEGAFEGTQSPNARLYLARCLAKLDRTVDAYKAMKATLELARDKAESDDKYAKTRDAAAAELALLEPKVGKVIVAFDEPYQDAVILLDGEQVAHAEQGVPIPVMPGDVQVTARAPGKVEFTETVEVSGGATKALAIVLDDAIVDEDEDDGPGLGTVRILGIVVAGLGVGGMVAFAVTGSMASSKFSEVEEACGNTRCTDLAFADDIDSGKSLQTIANVSLGVGLALMAGGAAMIVFGGPDEDSESGAEAALQLTPLVGGGFVGLTGRF